MSYDDEPGEIPKDEHDNYLPDYESRTGWDRHVSAQPVFTIGLGAPFQVVGQYTFERAGTTHGVTLTRLLEDTDTPWAVIWETDGDQSRTQLQGYNQFLRETHDGAVEAIEDVMDEIENLSRHESLQDICERVGWEQG